MDHLIRLAIRSSSFLLLIFNISGCGKFKSIWGEKPPSRATVTLQSNSTSVPGIEQYFSHDPETVQQTIHQWRKFSSDLFLSVRGTQQDKLTEKEVERLALEGFIPLDDSRAISALRAKSLLRLLGFRENGISKTEVMHFIDWLEEKQADLKPIYKRFIQQGVKSSLSSLDLLNITRALSEFLIQTGSSTLTKAEIMKDIYPWLKDLSPWLNTSVGESLDLIHGFFRSFCGNRIDERNWNGKKVGLCLSEFRNHFEPWIPLMNFALGTESPYQIEKEKLRALAQTFEQAIQSWIEGHEHPQFPILLVREFSKKLNIPEPYSFTRLTEWTRLLDSKVKAEHFRPEFFIGLGKVIAQWTQHVLNEIPSQPCNPTSFLVFSLNPQRTLMMTSDSSQTWKLCPYTGKHPIVSALFSHQYGTPVRNRSLGEMSKILFFYEVSQFVFLNLDHDASGRLENEVYELMTLVTRLLDSSQFLNNIFSRLKGLPIDTGSTEESLKHFSKKGLSKLAFLASDLIPNRPHSQFLDLSKDEEADLDPAQYRISEKMDPLGLTFFIYLYSFLNEIRQDYLSRYSLGDFYQDNTHRVPRLNFIRSLRAILKQHFPRVHDACEEWGFEKTCGVFFTEIIPGPGKESTSIEAYEMDTFTLSAVLLEALTDRCDINKDGVFSQYRQSGFDEKRCIIRVASATVQALMESKILENNETPKKILSVVQNFFLARWAGKAALARGTLRGIWWRGLPPLSVHSAPASLGSVMSLATELMAEDRVNAILAGTEGPAQDPGDEWVYRKRMSQTQ